MGWKRILLRDEEKKKKEAEIERKKSKTMEDFGAAVIDSRVEKEQLEELDTVQWNKPGEPGTQEGPEAFLASLTKVTRGLQGIITPEALQELAWQIGRCQVALDDGNLPIAQLILGRLHEYYSLFAPLLPKKDRPDIVMMPYQAKPVGYKEEQKLIES